MKNSQIDAERAWTERWIESVASGTFTMSQRRLTAIDRFGGGLARAKMIAEERGVHLLQLTDDQDQKLVAASRHPFIVVC